MPDKTTVTNGSVSESGQAISNPPGEGQIPSREMENRIRENLRREDERRSSELSAKLEESQNRIAQLEEQSRLTESDKREKARLENKTNELEDELRILDTDPRYRAYNEKIRREAERVGSVAEQNALAKFYKDAVDELIDEASETDGVKPEELRKDLNKLMRMEHQEMIPTRRVKSLLKEWRGNREKAKAEEDRRKKEDEDRQFMERSGRAPRELSMSEAKEKGDVLSQLKNLGKYKGIPAS